MIPKIIHYCWFGDSEMPAEQQEYINGWKKLMPDYDFKCWSEQNMNVKECRFIEEAYEKKVYAFVADFTRLYALYTFGGIYLDTDVIVHKRFDEFLKFSFFTSYEFHPSYNEYKRMLLMLDEKGNRIVEDKKIKIPGAGLLSAIIGAEKESKFISDCLGIYYGMTYSEAREKNYTIPSTLAIAAEKYGFRYIDEFQLLNGNIAIFPSKIFADYRNATKDSIAVHNVAGSWGDKKSFLENIIRILYRKRFIRTMYMNIRNIFEHNPLKY